MQQRGRSTTLSRDVLNLPADERLALARFLLESVEPTLQGETEADLGIEILDRIKRLDGGDMETIPAEEVFARLRQVVTNR